MHGNIQRRLRVLCVLGGELVAAGVASPVVGFGRQVGLAQGPATWVAAPTSVTVGDTVHLTRTLPASPQVRARPQPLPSTPVVESLADPVAELAGDFLVLRYAVAVFEPGMLRIAMPSVELLYPDGNAETVLGDTVVVAVRAVLPAGDSLPPPRPSLAPLRRPRRDASPAAALLTLAAAGTVAWVLTRKRVGPRPSPPGASAPEVAVPLRSWVEAGEVRAAAAALANQLRRTIAALEPSADAGLSTEALLAVLRRRCPAWPLAEIEDLLRALERSRFAPAVAHDVLSLAEQVGMLAERLGTEERVALRAGPFEVAPLENG